MSRPATHTTPEEADLGDAGLDALEAALADQVQHARRGDVEGVCELARQVDSLLAEARRRHLEPCEEGRRRLARLHDQVQIALTQQRDEVARQRADLRRGKDSLRAYRDAASGT